MKTILLILNIVLFGIVSAQTPNWSWVKSAGGFRSDNVQGISTDANGNCYVTGYFGFPAAFGSFTLTGSSNTTYDNFFIAKYDSTGNVQWAKEATSTTFSKGFAIKTDATGNSYVVGEYGGTLILGNFTLTAISSAGTFFIAKYDPSGDIVWAANTIMVGGLPTDRAVLGIDAAGNSYVSIQYEFDFTADSATCLMKFNAAGNMLWRRIAKSTGQAPFNSWKATSVATDANGNSYLCGIFTSSVLTIGGVVLTQTTTQNTIIFLAKYDNAGNVLWAKSTGGDGTNAHIQKPSASIDLNGNVYVTGIFYSPFAGFGTTILTKALSDPAYFIAKFDNSGNVIWAKGGNRAQGNAIANDVNGNVYTAGFFGHSTVSSGTVSTNFDGITVSGNGRQEIFVAKYNPSGNILWVKSAGGAKEEAGTALTADGQGNVYIGGNFSSYDPVFDNIMLANCDTFISPYTTPDIFVAKLRGGTITGIAINSMNQRNLKNTLSIFPNPLSGEAIIKTNQQLENVCMTVYNSAGEVVMQRDNLNTSEIKFSRENLPAGLYFIQIREDLVTISGKAVVTD